jgi:hypothetical protein
MAAQQLLTTECLTIRAREATSLLESESSISRSQQLPSNQYRLEASTSSKLRQGTLLATVSTHRSSKYCLPSFLGRLRRQSHTTMVQMYSSGGIHPRLTRLWIMVMPFEATRFGSGTTMESTTARTYSIAMAKMTKMSSIQQVV